MSFWIERTNLSRPVIALINVGLMMVLTVPAILSLGPWSGFTIGGLAIIDLEDFAVSNLFLPIGSLLYVVFCTTRYGWGWKNFYAEVNTGNGLKFPRWIRPYMTFVLPVIILVLLVISVL